MLPQAVHIIGSILARYWLDIGSILARFSCRLNSGLKKNEAPKNEFYLAIIGEIYKLEKFTGN
jgi:hypothetical protein